MLTSTQKRIFEYAFIIIAASLLIRILCLGSSNLIGEEAYYWNYAVHLDFSYLDHPPMVGVLIKLFTTIFGTNEFGVRIAAVICWIGTAFFSFKLTQLIKPGAGRYAVMLLAILPFFFLHSLFITPDSPLILCWSAAVYYLYQALVLDKSTAWYIAGIWLGLGMLSKYTIVLLGPTTLVYLIWLPNARKWLLRKEPYLCLILTALMFTPVIYWNAIHDWASFAFQGTRRLHAKFSFSFHELLGLFIMFLTPLGVIGFSELFRNKISEINLFDIRTRRYLQIYTLVPLAVFSLYSFSHEIKFNWIGPSLLAIIPWLAILIEKAKPALRQGWLITAFIALLIYSGLLFCMITGTPIAINHALLNKYIAWSDLTQQINAVAMDVEKTLHTHPLIVPMDYNLNSELNFYQAKLLTQKKIPVTFKIIGNHIFGHNSLMFNYWSGNEPVIGKTLLLVAVLPENLQTFEVTSRVTPKSEIKSLWAHSQGRGDKTRKYYYQIVQMTSL